MGLHWNLSLGKCKWLTAQSRADPQRRLRDTCTAFTNMRKILICPDPIFYLQAALFSDDSLVIDQQRANLNVLQRASLEGELAEISWCVTSHLEAHATSWNAEAVQQLLQHLSSSAT